MSAQAHIGPASVDEEFAMAIIDGSVERAEKLLEAGASLDGAQDQSYRPLLVAASSGHDRIVELLAKRGADLEAQAPRDVINGGQLLFNHKFRALHAALNAGVSTVRLLLRLGADPDPRDAYGNTPLFMACLQRRGLPVIQALAERGADPTAMSMNGMAAVHVAAAESSSDVLRVLLSVAPSAINFQGFGLTPLSCAVTAGEERVVRFLLSAGASDKEVLFRTGASALHHAVEGCDENILRILLDEGFEAAGGSDAIPGAMHIAVLKGQPRLLNMLVMVRNGEAPAHWARQFVRYKASISGDDRVEPILHMAARFRSPAAVSVLMRAGADENSTDLKGKRAGDLIGSDVPAGEKNRHEAEAAVIVRMLARGPASRARSWDWAARPGAGVGRNAVGVPLRKAPLGVRVFRPSSPKCFVRLFSGYSLR